MARGAIGANQNDRARRLSDGIAQADNRARMDAQSLVTRCFPPGEKTPFVGVAANSVHANFRRR